MRTHHASLFATASWRGIFWKLFWENYCKEKKSLTIRYLKQQALNFKYVISLVNAESITLLVQFLSLSSVYMQQLDVSFVKTEVTLNVTESSEDNQARLEVSCHF